jgi:hypothetical protein
VIWSSDKILIKTFDQVKKHNFDQVNFGQPTPCHCNYSRATITQPFTI